MWPATRGCPRKTVYSYCTKENLLPVLKSVVSGMLVATTAVTASELSRPKTKSGQPPKPTLKAWKLEKYFLFQICTSETILYNLIQGDIYCAFNLSWVFNGSLDSFRARDKFEGCWVNTFHTYSVYLQCSLFCALPTKLCFIKEKPGNMREIVVNNQSERSSLCTIDMLELKIAPEEKKNNLP